MTLLQPIASRDRQAWRARAHLSGWWLLIKDLQTGLLLITALAGYATGCCRNLEAPPALVMVASLFLAISGSTVLNMVLDRDIDGLMPRTAGRPLPSRQVGVGEASALGVVLTFAGVAWAFTLHTTYGLIILTGVLLDVVVYTALLKRRTPFAVIIGGFAGGMPVLAGRTLATGYIELVGVLLALAVLAWIPTHIMTLSMKYSADYQAARIPVFPLVYGERVTRCVIALSSIVAVFLVLAAGWLAGVSTVAFEALSITGLLLIGLVLVGVARPGARLNFVLYKCASLYMLASMVLLIAGGF